MVGLLFGGAVTYWFSAMVTNSVGKAALVMVKDVRDQFETNPEILTGGVEPDYDRCIKIATNTSLK